MVDLGIDRSTPTSRPAAKRDVATAANDSWLAIALIDASQIVLGLIVFGALLLAGIAFTNNATLGTTLLIYAVAGGVTALPTVAVLQCLRFIVLKMDEKN